ncbi:pyruvate formate lyase-activating protein [Candidatus Falkowbacteria bacterium]|nr:pyruvate formate lyase-activating protein [Candidatus Falkowbacteria bacterium]
MLKVHSIETFGTHEGPGIRLVIFMQGCNINCLYCHNPDTKKIAGGKEMSVDEVLQLLDRQKPYFKDGGGLSVSGGEPTLQTGALIELFREVKKAGYHTALDTNGVIASKEVEELYGLTDLLLLDVKHIDDSWHKKITGTGNASVLKMAEYREKSGKPMWLRYVLVPGYTDQEEHLHAFGRHFASYQQIERVEILPYHTFGVYKYDAMQEPYYLDGVKSPGVEEVEAVRSIFKQYFKEVIIR